MLTKVITIWYDIMVFAHPIFHRNSQEVRPRRILPPKAEMIST
jgi:hypothetical protein